MSLVTMEKAMKSATKTKLRKQQQDALDFERKHRMLWVETPSTYASLDDIDVQAELGVAECDPEYLLMVEQEPSLEDWLVGVDYDSVAPEPQSAVSNIRSFFSTNK